MPDPTIPLNVYQSRAPERLMTLQSLSQQQEASKQLGQLRGEEIAQSREDRQRRNAYESILKDPSDTDQNAPMGWSPQKMVRLAQLDPVKTSQLSRLQTEIVDRNNESKDREVKAGDEIMTAKVNFFDQYLKQGLSREEAGRMATEQTMKMFDDQESSGELSRKMSRGYIDQFRKVAVGVDPDVARGKLAAKGVKFAESQITPFQREELALRERTTAVAERRAETADRRAGAMEARLAGGTDESIPHETLTFMAKQYLRGDTSVMQNIGRGRQGAKNIGLFREEIRRVAEAEGISPEEVAARNAEFFGVKAGERALGTRTAQVGMAVAEAQNMVPLALQASEAADRTGVKSLNDALQAVQKGTASPELRKFVAANNSLVNVYARAISPSGVPTISDKDHAREVLSTAFSKKDYRAGVEQLMAEMNAAQQSPEVVRKEFRETVTGKRTSTPGDIKSLVETSGQKYEPEKYEYRMGPNGNVQRRAK